MGFDLQVNVSAVTVFVQGILSFFSPCVLPLLPLYLGYLSGGAKTVTESGEIIYKKSRVLVNTLFFVLGISFAFFLLGLGVTGAGKFFSDASVWITRIGGILLVLFGLNQTGVFGRFSFFKSEKKIPVKLNLASVNPFTALVLGFTFSFGWTPCIGPVFTSVLIMAGSSASWGKGFLLIGCYTLGFIIPFLVTGIFTGTLLGFFKKHQSVVRVTVIIGGCIMIIMGILMIAGLMNSSQPVVEDNFSAYTGKFEKMGIEISTALFNGSYKNADGKENPYIYEVAKKAEERPVIPAPDFTLSDQYGREHTLSAYKGKTVFLNFWATWCPPCRAEMPEIEELYNEYGKNSRDVVILGIAAPGLGREGNREQIVDFLNENGYTYPVVMDTTGEMFFKYSISAFPTTFMIDKAGNVFGYIPGQLSKDMMKSIITQTQDS